MAEEKIVRKKNKKPDFVVKESKFSARVKKRWRYPRGKHSKVRQRHRGRPALPSPGYGSPKELKNKHSSGLKTVLVKNKDQLLSLDIGSEGAIISSGIGKRNKLVMYQLALEKKITILNVEDVNEAIKDIEDKFNQRKKVKSDKLKEKTKKKEEKKKKADEKKKKEKKKKSTEKEKTDLEEAVEDTQKKEKRDIEKVITKRQ